MTYVLIAFAAILGYLVGKNVSSDKMEMLYNEIQAKEKFCKDKDYEITNKDKKIKSLEDTIGYLQLYYPAILELLEGRERSKGLRDIALCNSTNPALAAAYIHAKEEEERKAIEMLPQNRKELKTCSQYEGEISKLKREIEDYKIQLWESEVAGKYVLAFRNIVIEHADELKNDVKVIKAYNYDGNQIHGGSDVEIKFLKLNLPNYKYEYLN